MIFRKLKADEIDVRISQVNKMYMTLLLYKDARVDQNILDETVGQMNWQRHHSRDNANCIVSIWDDAKKQWIEKEDVGKESFTEAEKGLASDSFKRACFNWGIGRELYTAPDIKFKHSKLANAYEDNGKWKCYDNFHVKHISYDDNGNIKELSIVNSETGVTVFETNNANEKADVGSVTVPVETQVVSKETVNESCTKEQLKLIQELVNKAESPSDKQKQILGYYNAKNFKELTQAQAQVVINTLSKGKS